MPLVLIVHELPEVALYLREVFRWHALPVRLEHAVSAPLAHERLIDTAGLGRPDLILLGLPLHAQGGLALLRRMLQHRPFLDIPLVVLSVEHRVQDEERCRILGALFYFEFPATLDAFAPVVERCRQLLVLGRY